MPTLILLFLLLVSAPGWAATRLVIASGGATSGNCTSTACTLAWAITQAIPGDTITLANGTYGGEAITCNSNAVSGTSGQPITLKATNERQAIFPSNGGADALSISDCNYWTIEGLTATSNDLSSSAGDVVSCNTCTHVTFRRLLLARNNRYYNTALLFINGGDHNLVEESEFYQFHRHAILNWNSNDNIYRRNYCNSRGYADIGGGYASYYTSRGEACVTPYTGARNIMENNVSEGNGAGMDIVGEHNLNADDNKVYGHISLNDNIGLLVSSRTAASADIPHRTRVKDFVAITPTAEGGGVWFRGAIDSQCTNCTVIGSGWNGITADAGQVPITGTTFITNSLAVGGNDVGMYLSGQSDQQIDHSNSYNNGTNYTPAQPSGDITASTAIDPQMGTCYAWVPDASPMKEAGLAGVDIGANILYRYQDGAISSVPLWDTTTGAFPCGETVAGLNDSAGNSCSNVHQRLNINQGGCAFPSSYIGISPVERTALHITAAERTIWNQRIVAGTPYQSDWTRILGRADTFVATPTGTWTGNQLGVAWNGAAVVAGTQPPNVMPDGGNGGDRTTGDFVRDAGFVYAVTGTTSYRDAVLTLLLTQAAIAGTDFANTTKWATTYTDASEDFEIAVWLRKLVYAYSYIRPSISIVDQATLDAWFNVAGTYWALVLQNVTATRFPNRLSDDYATVSFSCVKPVGGSSAVTHFGGYAVDQFGFPWNNKRMNFAAMIAAVGATTTNNTLKSDAKRMFKEWLRSNIFPDGTSWEQARWTTGNPQSGFNYAWTTIGSASTIADHLARTGDTELYEYSTSEGNCGSEGGPKSLHQILQRYANITLGNTLVYASLTSTSDPNLLIDSSGPGGTLYNDVNLAQPNVYYRDTLLTSSYTRTMPSSWNAGGYDGFGGDWGHLPAARFMFGQMEGLVWPYAASPGPLGTVAKYLFSEGSGVTVADSSGYGHTGTFAPDAGWTTGRIGPYAGIFDGTRYVTIPGVSELRPTTQATLAGWFKATSTSVAGGNIVDLPNGGMSLYLNSAGRLVCQAFDGTNYPSITSGATYFDDAWRFASCSYLQGDGLYLRVNHTQVGFVALSIVLNYQGYLGGGGTGNVEIGRSSQASTLGFIGSIDQVIVKDTSCDTACDLALFQEGMSQRRIMVMGVR